MYLSSCVNQWYTNLRILGEFAQHISLIRGLVLIKLKPRWKLIIGITSSGPRPDYLYAVFLHRTNIGGLILALALSFIWNFLLLYKCLHILHWVCSKKKIDNAEISTLLKSALCLVLTRHFLACWFCFQFMVLGGIYGAYLTRRTEASIFCYYIHF